MSGAWPPPSRVRPTDPVPVRDARVLRLNPSGFAISHKWRPRPLQRDVSPIEKGRLTGTHKTHKDSQDVCFD